MRKKMTELVNKNENGHNTETVFKYEIKSVVLSLFSWNHQLSYLELMSTAFAGFKSRSKNFFKKKSKIVSK